MDLQVIRAQEFVRLGPRGHFDFKASKAALALLALALFKRGIKQALLDLRALHPGPRPVFSPNDLVALVNTFREVGFTRAQRLAVLYGSDPHHRARLFALIAKLRGWNVQTFDNFEQALHWLSIGEPAQPKMEDDSKPRRVPIHKAKPGAATARAQTSSRPVIHIKTTTGTPRRGGMSKRPPPAPTSLMKGAAVIFSIAFAGLAALLPVQAQWAGWT